MSNAVAYLFAEAAARIVRDAGYPVVHFHHSHVDPEFDTLYVARSDEQDGTFVNAANGRVSISEVLPLIRER